MNKDLNFAVTNYFDRVAMFGGKQRMIAMVHYLARHKLLGADEFIGNIVYQDMFPDTQFKRDTLLESVLKIIDNALEIEFNDEAVSKAVVDMKAGATTYARLFWMNALATYLDVPNDHISDLLKLLKPPFIIYAPTSGKVNIPLHANGTFRDADTDKSLTIHQTIAGTYHDILEAVTAA